MKIAKFMSGIGASCLLFFLTTPVSATLITFDDLPSRYQPNPPYTSDADSESVPMPLTNQYEHLGVLFGEGDLDAIARSRESNWGAAVFDYEYAAVSSPNVIGSFYQPGSMSFRFVDDELPDYVSFYVTSRPGPMDVSIYDNNGLLHHETLGYKNVDGELVYLDYEPRHFLEFSGNDIKEVHLATIYGHGTTAVYLDNLFFTNTSEVPEPGTLGLFLAGLMGVGASRLRRSATA